MHYWCRLSPGIFWARGSVAQRRLASMITTPSSVRKRRNELPEHVVGGHPGGLVVEVENEAVPECGRRDGPHVVIGHVEPALDQGADLGAQHDRLRPARANAVANVPPHDIWSFRVL